MTREQLHLQRGSVGVGGSGGADRGREAATKLRKSDVRTTGILATRIAQHDVRLPTKEYLFHRFSIFKVESLDTVRLQVYPKELHSKRQ